MTHIDTSKEAVERLLDGVTPGPWEVMETGFGWKDNGPTVYAADSELRYVAKVRDTFNITPTPDLINARFIAAARDLVPALAAERDAQKARADAAEAREQALVAAAYETKSETAAILNRLANDMDYGWSYNAGNHIRAFIPDDATDALIAMMQDARTAALREAAGMFDADSNIAQTILAMIEKDTAQ